MINPFNTLTRDKNYNTPQLLNQYVIDANLIFRVGLISIMV